MFADSSKPRSEVPSRRTALVRGAVVLTALVLLGAVTNSSSAQPPRADTVGCFENLPPCPMLIAADTVGAVVGEDPANAVRVAWVQRKQAKSIITFAEWTPARVWEFTEVDSSSAYAPGLAMTSDANGRPVIAYCDAEKGDLVVARRLGGMGTQFAIERPDTKGNVGMYPSLARTSGGIAVAYADETHGTLKYAEKIGSGAWSAVTVPGTRLAGGTSMRASGAARAIAYYDAVGRNLCVARRSAGVWTHRAIETAGDVGQSPSLIGDPAHGRLGISYYSRTSGDLKYAYTTRGAWATRVVDSAGDVGRYNSAVALGGSVSDAVGIAYYDATHRQLKFALKKGAWSRRVVDERSNSGLFVSSAASSNAIHLAYMRLGAGGIRYRELSRSGGLLGAPHAPMTRNLETR